MDLLDENEIATGGSVEGGLPEGKPGFSTQEQSPTKKKSNKFPPLKTNPNIWTFLTQVTSDFKKLTFGVP